MQEVKSALLNQLNRKVHRRKFLAAAGLLGTLASVANAQQQADDRTDEEEGYALFARLEFPGGDWYTDTLTGGHTGGAEINLLRRFRQNTTARPMVKELFVDVFSEEIFQYPFLYMSAHSAADFPEKMVKNLREHILSGGMLFVDDCAGLRTGSFYMACQRLFVRMLPESPIERINITHPIYHTAYDLDRMPGGDKRIQPDTVIEIDGRVGVFHCMNDWGCAWEGHRCSPGGELQRENCFKAGINLLVYALTH